MDLCFQNDRAAQVPGDVIDFVTIGRNFPARYRDAELRKNFLGLIFVYLHLLSSRWIDGRQLTLDRMGSRPSLARKAGFYFMAW